MSRRALTLAGLVLAVSACGGGDDAEAFPPLSVAKKCYEQAGVSAREWKNPHVGNLLPKKAPGGELIVEFGRNNASLFFDRNAADAQKTERQAERFIEASVGQFDGDWNRELVERRGNVTISWKSPPTDRERKLVAGCVGGSG